MKFLAKFPSSLLLFTQTVLMTFLFSGVRWWRVRVHIFRLQLVRPSPLMAARRGLTWICSGSPSHSKLTTRRLRATWWWLAWLPSSSRSPSWKGKRTACNRWGTEGSVVFKTQDQNYCRLQCDGLELVTNMGRAEKKNKDRPWTVDTDSSESGDKGVTSPVSFCRWSSIRFLWLLMNFF